MEVTHPYLSKTSVAIYHLNHTEIFFTLSCTHVSIKGRKTKHRFEFYWFRGEWDLRPAAAAKSLQSCPTLRPHRRQPTRLPRPWDSPGKNTGMGCHFLLQCTKVKSQSDVAQLCLTLSDPMDCSLPGYSIHGIFQARVLEWGAITFSDHEHYSALKRKEILTQARM